MLCTELASYILLLHVLYAVHTAIQLFIASTQLRCPKLRPLFFDARLPKFNQALPDTLLHVTHCIVDSSMMKLSIMLTNRMPSFSLLAAGSFILRLHLTTPSTQTSMSTTLTAPATTPPKKMLMTRGALSVAVCKEIKKHNSSKGTTARHLYRSPVTPRKALGQL